MDSRRCSFLESFWFCRRTRSSLSRIFKWLQFALQVLPQPDTWAKKDVQLLTADEILEKAVRYRNYWGDKGGITVSGGEPLLQMEFMTIFLQRQRS